MRRSGSARVQDSTLSPEFWPKRIDGGFALSAAGGKPDLSGSERAAFDWGRPRERLGRQYGSYSVSCGSRWNVGKAVMAGLVPAIHAAPPQISRQTSVSSEAYDKTAVFSWMAGSSPAMTENGILAAPTPYALRVDNILRKIRNRTKLALMNSPALSPSKIGGSRLRDEMGEKGRRKFF